jgi:Protein of unknown function (DUF3662)/FHA domain
MGALQKFERRLEGLISGIFARTFRSAVQPVEISAALQREVDNNAQILSRDRRLVPNDFHVELARTDLDRLAPYDSAMARDMTSQLSQYAEQQSYVFPGPVTIAYEVADDLTTGRFRIRSQALAGVTSDDHRTQVRAATAYLEINGTRHPLRPPGVVIGRGTEAHIRISDPGVSRQHVEFTVVSTGTGNGRPQLRITARDLGSTNGVSIDGHKSPSAPVHDGSTVVIGKTTIRVVVTEEDVDV